MIGTADLSLDREEYSDWFSAEETARVSAPGSDSLGLVEFFPRSGGF
jgi:hypothetical protein